jgi:hypothetical protein
MAAIIANKVKRERGIRDQRPSAGQKKLEKLEEQSYNNVRSIYLRKV